MTAETSLRMAARIERVRVADILRPRGREARRRRHLALYLAHVGLGLPLKHIARAVPCQRNIVRKMVREIEDQRDDPRIDQRISALEEALTCAA